MKKIMEKLNKHFFPLLVAVVLFAGLCLPIRASAEIPRQPIDFTELDYSVRYGTHDNQVTVPISSDFFYFNYTDEGSGQNFPYSRGEESYTFVAQPNRLYTLYVYPFSNYGLSLRNVPVGSRLIFDIRVDLSSPYGSPFQAPEFNRRWFYLDSKNNWLLPTSSEVIDQSFGQDFTVSYLIEDKANAVAFVPSLSLKHFKTLETVATTFTVTLRNVRLVMDIPVSAWEQFQTEQNGKVLGEINDQLGNVNDNLGDVKDELSNMVNGTPEQDQIANDSNNEMSAAAGKLDNLGDQLNSVNKPNVDNMDVSADSLLGGGAMTLLLTSPILEIWKNPVALSFLTVVVTLVLISWVFFGKK